MMKFDPKKTSNFNSSLLILSHISLYDHLNQEGPLNHPENAGRLQAILAVLEKSPYNQYLDLSVHRLATLEELKLIHDPAYINHVFSFEGKSGQLDPDTPVTPGSVHAARLAAGLGLEMVEQVVNGKIKTGWVLVRPPGHHACPTQAMGFCIFNNIALAAKKAICLGVKKILILDWDVHHGNGTQEAFYRDDRVLFIDIHQELLFPENTGYSTETGEGQGLGYTINIPLPRSSRDSDYRDVMNHRVRLEALKFQPELILVSAGFDAHEFDPKGSMCVTHSGFAALSASVRVLADELCEGRLIFFLEGGYDSQDLAQNVLQCIESSFC